jgi:hypothetical protein
MANLKLFWFFAWRMALWGLLLCTAAMVVLCIALQVGAVLMGRGWLGPVYAVFSAVVLGAAGAVVGLFLGMLCAAVLFVLARASTRSRPPPVVGYRKMAGRACAFVSVLALLADWLLHGLLDRYENYIDPYLYFPWRMLSGNEHKFEDFDLVGVIDVTVMVLVPTLLFASVMWWAGRRTAGRYAREFEAARGGAFATATWPLGGRIAGRRYGRGSLDRGDRE